MNISRNKISVALEIAFNAHKNEWRGSGSIPYLSHIFDVKNRLESWGIGDEYVDVHQTAILHDVVESGTEFYELVRAGIKDLVVGYVNDLTFLPGDVTQKEKSIMKSSYISSFVEKPVVSLVVKMADRACNIDDFLKTGDRNYAQKYCLAASSLFNAVITRKKDIVDAFGESVYQKISEEAAWYQDNFSI